jgi:nucleoside-diphosphate-sugar epimerase
MKVFVAGATGALGRVLVPQLVAGGHEVVGLTRTPSNPYGGFAQEAGTPGFHGRQLVPQPGDRAKQTHRTLDRIHADLTVLAQLACALARARAVPSPLDPPSRSGSRP